MSFKRVLAMLLSVMMVFSLLPMSAYAEDLTGEVPEEVNEELPQETEEEAVEEPAPEQAEEEEPVSAAEQAEDELEEIVTSNEPAAVPESVASVEGTEYATFAAAVEAAGGTKAIVLLANITDAYTLTAGETLIVQKDGYTITVNAPEGYQLNETQAEGIYTYTLTQYAAKIGSAYYLTVVDAVAAVPESGSDYTEITLCCDSTETATIAIDSARMIRLDLNGNTLQQNGNRKIISVKGGSTLEIVDNAGGGRIYGNEKSSTDGHGIYITDGTVNFTSGTIEGCTATGSAGGGGVRVNGTSAVFNMTGGTITGCSATAANGGAILVSSGTCVISGGKICNNEVTTSGKYAGGVRALGGSTTISGGYFYGNKIAGSESFLAQLSKGSSATFTFTGGWFSKTVSSSYVPENFVSSGKCADAPNTSAPYTILPSGTYTITYNLDGDTTKVPSAEGTFGTAVTLATPSLGASDAFSGWYLDSGMTGDTISGEVYFKGNVTLYGHVESGAKPVAQIGDTTYLTFDGEAGAYAAANVADTTSTITLLDDVAFSSVLDTVVAGANITIDLNGHSLSFDTDNTSARAFTVSGTLTIKNGTVYGPASTTKSGAVFYANKGGVITVESGTYINRASATIISRTTSDPAGQITVKGGWFSDEISNSNYWINKTEYKGVKVLSGVDAEHTFPAAAPYTVAGPNASITYDANGGNSEATPDAKTGVICVPGYNIENPDAVKLSTKYPFRSDYVFVEWNTKADGTGTAYTPGSETLVCTGDVTLYAQWKAAEASDYVVKVGDNSYTTLAEAMTVLNDGGTLALNGNVTENLTINKNITLDLNGYTLRGASIGSALNIAEGAVVTVKDSKGSGMIEGNAQSNGGAIDNKGTLTIESGTIQGYAPGYGGAIYNCGTLTINGGTFIALSTYEGRDDDKVASQAVYSMGTAVSVTVNGGSFTGSVSKASSNTTTEISIYAGTFSVDPSAYVVTRISDVTGEGPYTVTKCAAVAKIDEVEYKTVDLALAAAESGDTVTCYADVQVSTDVKTGVTLDLNNNKLGGTFVNNGEIKVYDSESFAVALAAGGSVASDNPLEYSGNISGNVQLACDVTFTGNCTVEKDAILVILGDATVNEGVTLTVEGKAEADKFSGSGDVVLKNGAYICSIDAFPDGLVEAEEYCDVTSNYDEAKPYHYEMTCALAVEESEISPAKHEVSRVILTAGEKVQLYFNDDYPNWNNLLTWATSDETVATVENGLVTAVAEGTAYITANNESYRIDVVDALDSSSVYGVSLGATKATLELYKTDTVNVPLLIKLDTLLEASFGSDGEAEFVPTISNVVFADPKTGAEITEALPFKAEALDDGTIEIAPNKEVAEDVYKGLTKVKGSYKYKLKVTINGDPYTTDDAITISVKKTLPKLKAAAVTINYPDAVYSNTASLIFTGGKVTSVYLNTDKANPAWASVTDSTVTFDKAYAPVTKALSGTLNLLCNVEGWADSIKAAVTVKVGVSNKAPAVALKASGNIDTAVKNSAITIGVTFTNSNGNEKYPDDCITICDKLGADVTEKFSIVPEGKVITVKQNASDLEAGSYTLTAKPVLKSTESEDTFEVTSKPVKLTVKTTAAKSLKASVTLKAAGYIDLIRGTSYITLTPTFKNYAGHEFKANDLTFYKQIGKVWEKQDNENIPFNVVPTSTGYAIYKKDGATLSTADKYAVEFSCEFTDTQDQNVTLLSKQAKLTIKLGKAKVTADKTAVTFFTNDKYSSAVINLLPESGLNKISKVEVNNVKDAALLDLEPLSTANTSLRISFAGNKVTFTKAKTFTLNVWFEGNDTTKPSATVKVKVEVSSK